MTEQRQDRTTARGQVAAQLAGIGAVGALGSVYTSRLEYVWLAARSPEYLVLWLSVTAAIAVAVAVLGRLTAPPDFLGKPGWMPISWLLWVVLAGELAQSVVWVLWSATVARPLTDLAQSAGAAALLGGPMMLAVGGLGFVIPAALYYPVRYR